MAEMTRDQAASTRQTGVLALGFANKSWPWAAGFWHKIGQKPAEALVALGFGRTFRRKYQDGRVIAEFKLKTSRCDEIFVFGEVRYTIF